MAAGNALFLASLARVLMMQPGEKHYHISKATAKQMLENEMYLHEELIHFLKELENSKNAEEGLFSGWLFWTAVVALVVLAIVFWLVRQRRKLQAFLQSRRILWPDLLEDTSEIEIDLSIYK